jgi:signal peptidase I
MRRGLAARAGVTLLNLLAPGLGLLRIGRVRDGLFIYSMVAGAVLVFVSVLAATVDISFGAYAGLVSLVLTVTLMAYALALWWTWRGSRTFPERRSVWSRWYVIIGAIVVSVCINWLLTSASKALYHNYYAPSESMDPTIAKNDHLVASMRLPKQLHRGDIVLVRAPGATTYIKRIVGLPGDRIALRGGNVFINGAAIVAIAHGVRAVSYPYIDANQARVYLERFPGEAHAHLIQDLGQSEEDNYPETTIAPGHVFVLGDNRDDSLDSRIPKELGGLEQVSVTDVIGQPLFFYWPRAKMGQSLRDK